MDPKDNMLKLKIKYFLRPEGEAYFPTWYDEVHTEASKQNGFIKMRYEAERNHFTVYLDFASQVHLDLWASTDQHDELAAKIESYLIKPEEVEQV